MGLCTYAVHKPLDENDLMRFAGWSGANYFDAQIKSR